MPSPFPGMNPFFEHVIIWNDFHSALFRELDRELSERLPEGFATYCKTPPESESQTDHAKPTSYRHRREIVDSTPGTPEPALTPLERDALSSGWKRIKHEEDKVDDCCLKVVRCDEYRAVSEITLVHPGAKGNHLMAAAYRDKKRDLARAEISLVELDLLVKGRRPYQSHLESPWAPSITEKQPYVIAIYPGWERGNCYVRSIRLDQPLPDLLIPLAPSLAPVRIPLQPLIHKLHDDKEGFARRLRYDRYLPKGLTVTQIRLIADYLPAETVQRLNDALKPAAE